MNPLCRGRARSSEAFLIVGMFLFNDGITMVFCVVPGVAGDGLCTVGAAAEMAAIRRYVNRRNLTVVDCAVSAWSSIVW